jgi:hypothetical protein
MLREGGASSNLILMALSLPSNAAGPVITGSSACADDDSYFAVPGSTNAAARCTIGFGAA